MTQASGSGYDDFVETLNRLKWVLTWAVSGALVLPIAAFEAELSPPWPPKGVVLLTAVAQLLSAVACFQIYALAHRKQVLRIFLVSLCVLMISGLSYMVAFSQLTFKGGPKQEPLVKGLVCTSEALSLEQFAAKCPLLTDKLIDAAERPDELWTTSSITVSRTIILLTWLVSCISLTFCFVIFIVFQSQQASVFRRSSVPPNPN